MKYLFKNKFFYYGMLIVLCGLYLFVRLYHILNFPIFTDEAIYVRWSQIAAHDSSWRFISLTDGKQPMFVWIAMVLMRFIQDPLFAGRFVSVLAGLASMIGLYFVGKETFKNAKIGIFASFLYLIYPFALVYDRMALYDSLVGAFAVWSLYISILLVRNLKLDQALIAGLVIGAGMLTKTNAFFSLALMLPTLIISDFTPRNWVKRLFRFGFLYAVVAGLAIAEYSILRLSPFFHIINEKNALFVYPYGEWKTHPFLFFHSNLFGLWDWFWHYVTIPWVILIGVSFIINKKFLKEKIVLVIWFIVPFVYLAFFGKTIYPRFIFFMTLPLLPLIAYSITYVSEYKNKLIVGTIFFLLALLPLRADYFVLFNFSKAPIPQPDLGQYYNDWPSGIGVREATDFFLKESQRGKIYVGTEGTFGLMPYALEIYLVDNPNIILKGFWPIEKEMPKELLDARTKYPTYFVSYQPCTNCSGRGTGPNTWPLQLVMRFNKPGGAYLSVFRVLP